MRPDFAQILDEALARLRAGASIEECLRAYPDHAAELEPMLRTAAAIQRQASATLPPSLEQWLAAGRREIQDLAREAYTRPVSPLERLARAFSALFAGFFRRGTPRLASSLLSALVICLLTFYTVDAAAASSLPGEYLYPWKLFSEQARISLAVNPNQRTQLVAVSVERRVAEIGALAERGEADSAELAETIEHLNDQVRQALDTLPAASPEVRDRTVARIGRLLVRAETDLREATSPDTPVAESVESAVADVADLREELPAEPSVEAAVVVPAPATPTHSPATPTPGVVLAAPTSPAAGGVATPISEPEPLAPSPAPATSESSQLPNPDPESPTASSTPQRTPEQSPTRTATLPTRTSVPTAPPTRTSVPTAPPTRTSVPTAPPTRTSVPTPSPTEQSVAPPAVPTSTALPTLTPVPPISAPVVPPTATNTAVPTNTSTTTTTNTPTATHTPEPSLTPTATNTPEPSLTPTATNTPEPSLTPTATNTPEPTETATPEPPSVTPTPVEADRPALRPILECVLKLREDRYVAFFGFRNTYTAPLEVAVGPDNRFSPDPIDRGQPTVFPRGRSSGYPNAAFSVVFDGEPIVWFLDGRTATASSNSRSCDD